MKLNRRSFLRLAGLVATSPVVRALPGGRLLQAQIVSVAATFGASWHECGLFDGREPGRMLAHHVFEKPIHKRADESFTVTWKVTMEEEE